MLNVRSFGDEKRGGYGFEYNLDEAPVAQWTEYLTSNQLVARSSRAGGAILLIGRSWK